MKPPNSETYAKMLGALEKDAFEDEVCARLGTCITDFQRIPRKPNGDGGLDGLSHEQSRAYCCYGPEQAPFKKNTKGLKKDILEKFRGDLRKLFELDYGTNKKLQHKPNQELKTILASGRKIKNIYLVTSCFESHQIIGALNDSAEEYKNASLGNYVESSVQVTILGPKDLAIRWAVDEHALFRIEERALIAKVQQAVSSGAVVPTSGDFDAKFDYLHKLEPNSVAAINRLADSLRKSWSAALALDNELAATSVALHRSLERARDQASLSADIGSLKASSPVNLLEEMRVAVKEHLGSAFGERLGQLSGQIADGEVARLIGECPIEWRK